MRKKPFESSTRDKRAARNAKPIPDSRIDFSDIPESTNAELKRARRVGRPKSAHAKQLIAIRARPAPARPPPPPRPQQTKAVPNAHSRALRESRGRPRLARLGAWPQLQETDRGIFQVLSRTSWDALCCRDGAEGSPARRPHQGQEPGRVDELSNLRALCSTCNQGAKNITSEKPTWIWLLAQIRRAGQDDQRAAFDWLRKNFGAEGKDG